MVSCTGKIIIYLFPFAPENLVSRDGFGRPVPRQPAHSQYSDLIWYLLAKFLPISAAASVYLCHHTPTGQSRVNRVTQLRTDDVHYRESAGTRPVVLKIVPAPDAPFAGYHGQINVRLSFPNPTIIGMKNAC